MPESSLVDAWLRVATDPPRAFGAALGRGRLRVEPEDFVVEEDLGFAPAGAGPHVLLKLRKRGANTEWVARELARAAGCRATDAGYAGLKDRHAVTTQWFSVPRPREPRIAADIRAGDSAAAAPDIRNRGIADLATIRDTEFEVLEAHAHTKKLPRGALAGNRFVIRVR